MEWNRSLSKVAETWVQLSAFVNARSGFTKSARKLTDFEIDSNRVEMSREVSRAYIQPLQGNR